MFFPPGKTIFHQFLPHLFFGTRAAAKTTPTNCNQFNDILPTGHRRVQVHSCAVSGHRLQENLEFFLPSPLDICDITIKYVCINVCADDSYTSSYKLVFLFFFVVMHVRGHCALINGITDRKIIFVFRKNYICISDVCQGVIFCGTRMERKISYRGHLIERNRNVKKKKTKNLCFFLLLICISQHVLVFNIIYTHVLLFILKKNKTQIYVTIQY